ncbi:FtsB family cell division protein [Geomonas sp. RF6]|uniref:FtsB family cell division protein n=1 Tax=Geomonas sp. RF6 TaxID=2897342 RepID=UPI0022AA68E9|nr:septum formation initiator family protein [Geomonas sp. RF6]
MQKRFFLAPAAIMAFILFFTVFGDRGLLMISRLHRDRDEMQQRLAELKGENEKLKREVSALQTDRRYLESIARRDFGLVRSNETIYQFPAAEQGAAPPSAQKPVQTAQKVEGSAAQGQQQAPPKPVLESSQTAEPKPATKVAQQKPVAKTEQKPVAKAEQKPVAKAEQKPAAKAAPKSAGKVEKKAKSEPKVDKRGAQKTEP